MNCCSFASSSIATSRIIPSNSLRCTSHRNCLGTTAAEAAARVKPGSPREFAERVKNALEGYVSENIQGCTRSARKLNENRITNAVGGRWTAALVKIVADMYI